MNVTFDVALGVSDMRWGLIASYQDYRGRSICTVGAKATNNREQVRMAGNIILLKTVLQHGCFSLLITRTEEDNNTSRSDGIAFAFA